MIDPTATAPNYACFCSTDFAARDGYKVLEAAHSGDDVRLVMEELQNKIVRVGEGQSGAFTVQVGSSKLASGVLW
jgi:hypothetical protein